MLCVFPPLFHFQLLNEKTTFFFYPSLILSDCYVHFSVALRSHSLHFLRLGCLSISIFCLIWRWLWRHALERSTVLTPAAAFAAALLLAVPEPPCRLVAAVAAAGFCSCADCCCCCCFGRLGQPPTLATRRHPPEDAALHAAELFWCVQLPLPPTSHLTTTPTACPPIFFS